MGMSNVLARMGSMTAPLVRITGELHPFVPNLIFGATALLGGGASLFLPETLNQPLPETIEDVETWSVPALASRGSPRGSGPGPGLPLSSLPQVSPREGAQAGAGSGKRLPEDPPAALRTGPAPQLRATEPPFPASRD